MIEIVLLSIVLIFMILYIERLLLIKAKKSNIRTTIMFGFVILMAWIINMDLYIFYKQTNQLLAIINLWSATSLLYFTTFIFSNIFSIIFTNRFGLRRSLLYSFLFATSSMVNLHLLMEYKILTVSEYQYHINIIHLLSSIAAFIMLISVLLDFKVHKFRRSRDTYFEIEFISYRRASTLLATILPITIISLIFSLELYFSYLLVLFFIFSILIYTYNKTTTIRFFQPNNHFQVFIINNSGSMLHQVNFISEKDDDADLLFSSWLFAFTSILTEFLDKDVKPEIIELQDGLKIYLSWEKTFFAVVVVDQASPFILPSIESTLSSIRSEINTEDFEIRIVSSKDRAKMDEIINRYFFFVNS